MAQSILYSIGLADFPALAARLYQKNITGKFQLRQQSNGLGVFDERAATYDNVTGIYKTVTGDAPELFIVDKLSAGDFNDAFPPVYYEIDYNLNAAVAGISSVGVSLDAFRQDNSQYPRLLLITDGATQPRARLFGPSSLGSGEQSRLSQDMVIPVTGTVRVLVHSGQIAWQIVSLGNVSNFFPQFRYSIISDFGAAIASCYVAFESAAALKCHAITGARVGDYEINVNRRLIAFDYNVVMGYVATVACQEMNPVYSTVFLGSITAHEFNPDAFVDNDGLPFGEIYLTVKTNFYPAKVELGAFTIIVPLATMRTILVKEQRQPIKVTALGGVCYATFSTKYLSVQDI